MSWVLRVLLADDEPLALERLLFAFRDIPDTEIVGTAANGIDAAAKIADLKPDVAVLDIQMPGRTGIGLVAGLELEGRPDIIFVTAYDQHAVDAFDLDAADYVLKPLRVGRLRQAVERVRRRRSAAVQGSQLIEPASRPGSDDAVFWVQEGRGSVRIRLEDIEWIEAAKDYVLLHTESRSCILRTTMAAIQNRYPAPALLRVHRSAFVRPAAIRSLHRAPSGGATIVLRHDVAVRVGATYLRDVTSYLERLL